jgi:hypothetical protein
MGYDKYDKYDKYAGFDPSPPTRGETVVERHELSFQEKFDLDEAQHRRLQEKREIELRERQAELDVQIRRDRQDFRQKVLVGLAIFLAVMTLLGFCGWWWFGPEAPDAGPSDEEIVMQREEKCLDRGGVWLAGDLFVSDKDMCVVPPGTD